MALASSPALEKPGNTTYKLRTTNYEPNTQHSWGLDCGLGGPKSVGLFFWFRYSSVGVEHSCRTAGHWNSGTVLICTVPDCSRVFTFTVLCLLLHRLCFCVFVFLCFFLWQRRRHRNAWKQEKKKSTKKKTHVFVYRVIKGNK